MSELKNNLSKYCIYFCLLVVATFIFISKDWNKENKVIANDIISYYAYLPATFIFHDIKLENKETHAHGIFWPTTLSNGNQMIKTSIGMSVLYAPFFLISHVTAKIFGLEAYGYSPIYKVGLLFSAFFFFFIGLLYLRKTLKIYFSATIVAITLLVISLGTNLLYYVTGEATMSHIYNFALINIFVWYTIKWYKNPKLFALIGLGFLSGLIALVRPSNIIILIFFFLYNVYSFDTFLARIKMVFGRIHWFIIMGIAFVLVWIPQMIYWWSISGHLFVNSYQGERFFWGNPHFIDGLFSYRKGWLVYTPVMVFALVGIPLLFKKIKEFSWVISIYIILALYIVFSWWCWWYGGSFGMRSIIDYYGILAIPMALLFTEMAKLRKNSVIVVLAIALLAVSQNIFFIEKYKRNSLHWDSTTKASFWFNFWNIRPQQGYWELLREPDYENARQGTEEYRN